MNGFCKDCRWWDTTHEFKTKEWGECVIADCEAAVQSDKHVVIRHYSDDACLLTAPDFGCVKFEEKLP